MVVADICMFSLTSKHIRELCQNHFRLKYPGEATEQVLVEFDYFGKLRYDNYVKFFRNSIENIKINGWVYHPNQPSLLVNFMRSKCAKNLHTIYIDGDIELKSFSEAVRSCLCNVRVVKFNDRLEDIKDEATFLKYCPKITKLILGFNIHAKKIEAILNEKFSELTHFYCVGCDMLNAATFFELNDKIKWVSWQPLLRYDGNASNDKHLKCILSLKCASNLKFLFLSIEEFLIEKIEDICEFLNILCDRDNFTSLELQLFSDTGLLQLNLRAHQLGTWKQLTKIRLFDMRLSDVIPAFRSLVHLKIVAFKALLLPQVEEVQIEICDHQKESSSVILCVKYWKNLKNIRLYKSYGECVKYNTAELSCARGKLKNACHVTIFSDHKKIKTDVEHELVKVKFVNFETDFDNNFQQN